MIIVEGPDNAGKSTLIRQLLELDPSLRILHRERFDPSKGETIASSYLQALLPSDGDRVAHANSLADRFFASECIYGKLFRGGCRMSEREHWTILNLLRSYGALIVFCDPGDKAIMASWSERGQLYDDALKIAAQYRLDLDEIFEEFPQTTYDYTDVRAGEHRDEIIAWHHRILAERQTALSWWSAIPFGVGELVSPGIVLIGEGLSPRATTTIPFAHGPAGDFLAWVIKRAEKRTDQPIAPAVYITNADKGARNNAALLREELRNLNLQPGATIIALGREAEQMLTYVLPTLGLERVAVAALPHPMFWKRFKFSKKSEYVTKFLKAISGDV